MKGWELQLDSEGSFEIRNPGPNGEKQYFTIVPGPYSPVILEEPENAIQLGVNRYKDASGQPLSPQMKVKGVICKDKPGTEGRILYRSNLTNFLRRDGGVVHEDGAVIEVQGARYRLYRLVAENKNRILGYIGFYMPEADHDGTPVEVVEVENLG